MDDRLAMTYQRYEIPKGNGELNRTLSNNTYLICNNQRYKRLITGALMDSPLSPIVANHFTTSLENRAIETSEYKPKLWIRYT